MFNLFKKTYKKRPVVLVILDGFGIAPPSAGNAVTLAKTPNINKLTGEFPHTELIASGESVGLPANEEGNTEVGHLTLGAGRVMLQDLKRIGYSIESGRFFDNKVLIQASAHCKRFNSKFHIMGLVGSGHVHSSVIHLKAIVQYCKKEGIENPYLHIFTDGRDSPPKEGIEIVKELESYLDSLKCGHIASVAGRYYAMDRDLRWDRIEKAYKAIVIGRGHEVASIQDAVSSAYAQGQTDEFIEPSVVIKDGKPMATIDDNDVVVFFNFRIDRPRELTMAITLPDFENRRDFDFGYDPGKAKEVGKVEIGKTFNREKVPKNLFFATMTEYQKNLPVTGVLFSAEQVTMPLAEVISKNSLRQLHMAESEKERFVKYYFNGMREEPYDNESDVIVPSPKVATYDKKPQMSLPELVSRFKKEISKDVYDFAVINFANSDMVAHTGNLNATIYAIQYVDKYLNDLVNTILMQNGVVLITADHGNAEELITYNNANFFITTKEGTVNTDHSNNPVPLYVIGNSFRGGGYRLTKGALADVAPTILSIMGIAKPPEMTGRNLLEKIT